MSKSRSEIKFPKGNELLLILILGLVTAVFIGFVKANFPFENTDLYSYWSAWTLYMQGKNPYDISNFQNFIPSFHGPSSLVWNPPFIYLLATPIFALPVEFFRTALRVFEVIALLTLLHSIAPVKGVNGVIKTVVVLLAFSPLWTEFYVEQFSLILTLLLLVSIYYFSNGNYVRSGFLFALLVLKPHNFIFIGIYLLVCSMRARAWSFFVSWFLSVMVLLLLAEASFHGITSDFISREEWPAFILGSNWWSLLISISPLLASNSLVLRWSLFGLGAFIAVCLAIAKEEKTGLFFYKINWLIVLTPFLSPYGFLFDQVYLLIPLFYFLNSKSEVRPQRAFHVCLLIVLFIQMLFVILRGELVFNNSLPLIYWFSTSLFVLLIASFESISKIKAVT